MVNLRLSILGPIVLVTCWNLPEAYVTCPPLSRGDRRVILAVAQKHDDGASDVLSGVEWHDRFMTKLRRQNGAADVSVLIKDALEMAVGKKGSDSNRSLVRLEVLKGWLDSFCPLPPAVTETLKEYYDVLYTYHSNAIEGNTLTRSETQVVLEYGITIGGKRLVEHLEVVGHKDAIDYVEALSKEPKKITEFEIKHMHSLICRGTMRTEAGSYRHVDVRPSGSDRYYPFSYLVPQMMSDFMTWLDGAKDLLHPVLYAAEAHYRFVAIHPFRDGNGRIARLLMNLVLLRAGYPLAVIKVDDRAEYIDALAAADKDDDLSRFNMLIMAACEAALADVLGIAATAGDSRGKGVPFYRASLSLEN